MSEKKKKMTLAELKRKRENLEKENNLMLTKLAALEGQDIGNPPSVTPQTMASGGTTGEMVPSNPAPYTRVRLDPTKPENYPYQDPNYNPDMINVDGRFTGKVDDGTGKDFNLPLEIEAQDISGDPEAQDEVMKSELSNALATGDFSKASQILDVINKFKKDLSPEALQYEQLDAIGAARNGRAQDRSIANHPAVTGERRSPFDIDENLRRASLAEKLAANRDLREVSAELRQNRAAIDEDYFNKATLGMKGEELKITKQDLKMKRDATRMALDEKKLVGTRVQEAKVIEDRLNRLEDLNKSDTPAYLQLMKRFVEINQDIVKRQNKFNERKARLKNRKRKKR